MIGVVEVDKNSDKFLVGLRRKNRSRKSSQHQIRFKPQKIENEQQKEMKDVD
jgi:hypothetical protein